jgi:hypothetical protein
MTSASDFIRTVSSGPYHRVQLDLELKFSQKGVHQQVRSDSKDLSSLNFEDRKKVIGQLFANAFNQGDEALSWVVKATAESSSTSPLSRTWSTSR